MKIIPCTYKTACDFVNQHHRHHIASQGCKFCLGLMNDDKLCGVAICGRPVSRHLVMVLRLKSIVFVLMEQEMPAQNYMVLVAE